MLCPTSAIGALIGVQVAEKNESKQAACLIFFKYLQKN
jgi:hypothetical protein